MSRPTLALLALTSLMTLAGCDLLGIEAFELALHFDALALEAIALLAQGRYFGLARGDGVKRRIICPTLAKPGEKQ